MLVPDPETSGEKGEVSLWWDECGASSDATAQAEEEGQQDGLDDDGLMYALRTALRPLLSITWHFPRLLIFRPPVFPLFPIFTSLVFFVSFSFLLH